LTLSLCIQQKIPSRLIPEQMEKTGTITIVCHPRTEVTSTYSISELDGRLCVSGWKEFMAKENHLKKGDKMLFLLYLGTEGLYLFASHVPEIGLY
jgi:hypothetical protein